MSGSKDDNHARQSALQVTNRPLGPWPLRSAMVRDGVIAQAFLRLQGALFSPCDRPMRRPLNRAVPS
jgi:hypothetical protein